MTALRSRIRAATSRPCRRARPQATAPPVCLYLEVTNRCNLLCETCPRTFETLEPPADMSWELFTSIVDQVPDVARVVLHGVGEPMLVKALPRMIRYLKDRGVYVLFNTNGTLLSPKKHQAMIDTGLDELRVSLDAADAKIVSRGARQEFLRPHRAQCARVHRTPARDRRRVAARVAVAHRPEGDDRAAAGVRPSGGVDGRARGVSAAAGLRRGGLWPGAAGIVAVRDAARR